MPKIALQPTRTGKLGDGCDGAAAARARRDLALASTSRAARCVMFAILRGRARPRKLCAPTSCAHTTCRIQVEVSNCARKLEASAPRPLRQRRQLEMPGDKRVRHARTQSLITAARPRQTVFYGFPPPVAFAPLAAFHPKRRAQLARGGHRSESRSREARSPPRQLRVLRSLASERHARAGPGSKESRQREPALTPSGQGWQGRSWGAGALTSAPRTALPGEISAPPPHPRAPPHRWGPGHAPGSSCGRAAALACPARLRVFHRRAVIA
jgi:hypothetical protein